MSDNAIIVENVTKRFDSVTAVDNLSLEIKWGELFGLLGPNGAGKTTLINVLSTLLSPTEGGAQVGGFDVEHDGDNVRRIIGVCPQEPAYYGHLTGRENIELFGTFHDVPKVELKERAEKLIQKIGMEDHADRKSKEYSGGMVRRVSTVMSLIHEPKVALLDEPTVAMDPQSRRAVWDFIKELRKKEKTVILTTHYMEEAEELCDRVGIIDHGKVIALGKPQDLISENKVKNLEEVFIALTGRKIREEV